MTPPQLHSTRIKRNPIRLGSLLKGYGEESTIHGISYVLNENQPKLSRPVWALVMLCMILMALMASISYFNEWQSEPVLTTVRNTAASISDALFPAITICGQGTIERAIEVALEKQFENFVTNRTGQNSRNLTDHQLRKLHFLMTNEFFPGLNGEASPDFLVRTMLADNVNNVVAAAVISDDGLSACRLRSKLRRLNQCENGQKIEIEAKTFCVDIINDEDEDSKDDDHKTMSVFYEDGFWDALAQSDVLKENETFLLPSSINAADLLSQLNKSRAILTANLDELISNKTNLCIQGRKINNIELSLIDCNNLSNKLIISRICPEIEYNEVELRERRRQLLTLALDPEQKERRVNLTEIAFNTVRNIFARLDKEKSFPALFEVLWKGSFPCFDTAEQRGLLKKCIWREKEVDCSALFEATPTNLGMCCSFNLRQPQSFFRDSPFLQQLRRMRSNDNNKKEEEKEEEIRAEPGLHRGLTVLLDLHNDALSASSVSSSFSGLVSFVHSRSLFPSLPELSPATLIQPGNELRVALTPLSITMHETLNSTDPLKRRCFLPNESALKAHVHYDLSACVLECRLQHALNEADRPQDKCIPWYLPKLTNEMVCDPWATRRFLTRMQNLSNENGECLQKCLPNCEEMQYSSKVSMAKLRQCDYRSLATNPLCKLQLSNNQQPYLWSEKVLGEFEDENLDLPSFLTDDFQTNLRHLAPSEFAKDQLFTFTNEGNRASEELYDAFHEDLALVTFYFDQPTMMHFERQPRTTTLGFVAQIGGLLGLCLGFSFVSAVEIVYWFLLKPLLM